MTTELIHATWLKSCWKKHTETQRELTHASANLIYSQRELTHASVKLNAS